MYSQYPYPEYGSVWNIGVSILLSLLTLGIYGLYWQYKQMLILNTWLGTNESSFRNGSFLALSLVGFMIPN